MIVTLHENPIKAPGKILTLHALQLDKNGRGTHMNRQRHFFQESLQEKNDEKDLSLRFQVAMEPVIIGIGQLFIHSEDSRANELLHHTVDSLLSSSLSASFLKKYLHYTVHLLQSTSQGVLIRGVASLHGVQT